MWIKNIIIAIISFAFCAQANAEPAPCDRITSEKDDFSDKITYLTPLLTAAHITKIKDKRKPPVYYLSLTAMGLTPVVDGKGATILFEDGKKWSKSVTIDVDASENGFRYSAFIPLNKADLNLLKSKKISKFKLYIFEQTLFESDSNGFIQDVNCIINS
jgi:hypothetical protein